MPAESPPPAQPVSPPAVDIRDLSFSYPRSTDTAEAEPALRDISLRVESRERLGVLGPNGGGKSTLLRLILGLEKPDRGSIAVFGRTPQAARAARLIGYLPQRVEAELRFPVSVRQVVEMSIGVGLAPWRRIPKADRDRTDRVIELVGLTDLQNRPIGHLSGGQMQRAMIARSLAAGPKLLLLDEPTVGVDVSGQHRFAALIESLRAEMGLTIITVSHDLRAIALASDRVACLRGSLHYHDSPTGLTPRVLAEVFSHDVEAIFGAQNAEATAIEALDHARTHPACDDASTDQTGPARAHD